MHKSNFYLRAISAMVLIPPVIFALYVGGIIFFLLLFLVIMLAGWEWGKITGGWSFGLDDMSLITTVMLGMLISLMGYTIAGILCVIFGAFISYLASKVRLAAEGNEVIPNYLNRPLWFFIGSCYLGFAFVALAYVYNLDFNRVTIFWVIITVILSDTFAYIVGTIVGGKTILPAISPKKTWSGFFGAAIASIGFTYIYASIFGNTNEWLLLIGLFICIFAHIGDMLESAYKRYLGIKDTSGIIPGHGGVLDRIDALLMVFIFIALMSAFLGGSPMIIL